MRGLGLVLSLGEDLGLGAPSVFAATNAEPCKLGSSLAKDREFAIFQAWSWVIRADGSGNRYDCFVADHL